ncbi:MAG: amidohydrolase family protein [Acidobacteria bacterium]|nr:amidohydrolase family protein [Acidobacteriota bacterium]
MVYIPRAVRPQGPGFRALLLSIALSAVTITPASAGEAPEPAILAVVGGTLIDGTGADPVPDSAVIIVGDRIVAAGPRRQIRIPAGAVPVDATDLTVIPGLIDMHVHLRAEVDLRAFLDHGVTSVRHLGDVPLEEIIALKQAVDAGARPGPRIFHCGLFVVSEPPLKPEMYPPADLALFEVMHAPSDAPATVQRLLDAGADVVKVKTEMSPACLQALGAAAADAGLPLAFDNGGETGSYDALAALGAGARSVEHLTGIPFDDPEAVDRVLAKMVELGAFADPTLVVLDRTYAASRVARREEFIRRFAAAGGRVVAGTDVPTRGLAPGVSLHQEMERLVAAGLSPKSALLAATGNAGRALGFQGLVGTIEAGAYADLLVVAGDPLKEIRNADRVLRIFKGGVEYLPGPDEEN